MHPAFDPPPAETMVMPSTLTSSTSMTSSTPTAPITTTTTTTTTPNSMPSRPEPEAEAKVARTYSLASAPLRLLSHSFHSTANSHPGPGHDPTAVTTDHLHWHLSHSAHLQPLPAPQDHDLLVPLSVPTSTTNHLLPSLANALSANVPSAKRAAADCHPSAHDLDDQLIQPRPKLLRLSPPAVSECDHLNRQRKKIASLKRFERLFMPYDIRYSIFGHLSLQDIFHCQLTCKMLYWATSDQFIWKRIALDLIQGEFYFDIPRTLPSNIPNWKYFCKRHLLRQRNWRLGQVQNVIQLNDDYKKLTTLQIMSPFVLTGCDDGRVHLWNVQTRSLLHRFQFQGEITWVEYLQDHDIVAGLGYDIDKTRSEIRLFSTQTGKEIGYYTEDFWDLAICAINDTYLVASDGQGRYTTWDWKTRTKVSQFLVQVEESITEALYLFQNTILELHYDGLIRLFSITGECYGRFTLDKILPNNQISFCWFHNDFSMVVWESSNTMAHIRLPLLQKSKAQSSKGSNDGAGHPHVGGLDRPISQEEWDAQGAEVFWRHRLTHNCNFAAMGGGRFQLLYVEIFENLKDQVPIRVLSLKPNRSSSASASSLSSTTLELQGPGDEEMDTIEEDGSPDWQHGEYVTAHSQNPKLEKIIQGLRPSRIDCDPEYIAVGLVQGGVRLLQFAPVDDELLERDSNSSGLVSTGVGVVGEG